MTANPLHFPAGNHRAPDPAGNPHALLPGDVAPASGAADPPESTAGGSAHNSRASVSLGEEDTDARALRSARGRSVARRGKTAERDLAKWARTQGYPHAERVIRTGYRASGRQSADTGDVALCPGVIVQVKTYSDAARMERAIPRWMAETEQQRQAAGAEIALLVVKRNGCANPGDWWCWLPLDVLTDLAGKRDTAFEVPARLLLADVLTILRANCYGDPDHGATP